AAQPDAHGTPQFIDGVSQDDDLRRIAIFYNHLLTSVAVKVGQGERPTVLKQIQPAQAGDVRKTAVSVVKIDSIAFETSPAVVGTVEIVGRVLAMLVVPIGFGW